MRRALGTVAVFAVVSACTATPSAPSPTTSPTESTSLATGAPRGTSVFVRSCDSAVFGDLGANWRSDAANVGRLHLLGPNGYEGAPDSSFRHPAGRLAPLKFLAVVDEGRPVAVWVPSSYRLTMGLVFDPELFNRKLSAEAYDAVVRFVPCGEQHTTQFNGGVAVSGPGCYPLMVRSDGNVQRLRLPLGIPCA